MIILDTDICLALLKGNERIIVQVGSAGEEVCVSSVTVHELFYAANRSKNAVENRILVEKFLLTVRILHADLAVSKYVADTLHTLARKEKRANLQDVMIYSMSRVFGAKLITTNARRYCFT